MIAEHPNTVDAREHRKAAIMHAARTLFRDHTWLDPEGDLSTWEYLCRIPYMDKHHHRSALRAWVRNARIESATPVGELRPRQREQLIREMIRYVKGESS